jgi:hypothetical protein
MADAQSRPQGGPDADPVVKCVKFFKTLLNLTQQNQGKYEVGTTELVRNLVENVISGTIQPEEFTTQLQAVLKSQAQPHLLPFIQKTLPSLRVALMNGQQTIEGIRYNGQPKTEPTSTPHQVVEARIVQPQKIEPHQQPVHFPPMMDEEPMSQKVVLSSAPAMPSLLENLPYTMLDSRALFARLVEQVPGCEGIEQEVIAKISEVAESQLRQLLLELSEIAGHRLEPLKMNPMYQQINDPRKQLKFIEELERQAFIRQETVEKEALLKSTKVKSKDKETNMKAKEIKNANQEERLNREANEAAMSALGGSRNLKAFTNRFDPMKGPIGPSLSTQALRPRTRRINIRDLQCALRCRNTPGSNSLVFAFPS